jgi:hypothetical protein
LRHFRRAAEMALSNSRFLNTYYFGNIRDYLNPKGFMVGRAKRAPP